MECPQRYCRYNQSYLERYSKREFVKACRSAQKVWEQRQSQTETATEQKNNPTEGGEFITFSLMNDKSFAENVDDILSMNNDDAQRNAKEGNFVRIMNDTPSVILDNVSNAQNHKVIVSFYSLYLAARKSGALEGHYHNLGDLVKNLPDYIANPQAIVRMDNGRINLFNQIQTARGSNGILSIELNTVKDINNKNDKYNLVITIYSANDNHTQNNIANNGVKVEYQKEDLSQVNPQLYKWLATINEKSSTINIPTPTKNIKKNISSEDGTDTETRQYSLPNNVAELLRMFKNGQIDGETLKENLDNKQKEENPATIAKLRPEDASTTLPMQKREGQNKGDKESGFYGSAMASSTFDDSLKEQVRDDSYIILQGGCSPYKV